MSDQRTGIEKKAESTKLSEEFRLRLFRASLEDEGVPIGLSPNENTAIVPQFNAALPQKAIAFLPEDGNYMEWEGQGEGNDSATPWVISGYNEVWINVQHQQDGKWQNSLLKVKKHPMPSPDRTVRVLAEDGDDNDWNDTIVFIVPNPVF